MVTSTSAFWDTSALVPLCLTQKFSAQTKTWSEQHGIVAWWAARTEVESAVARVYRSGELTSADRLIALDRLAILREEWDEVPPSDEVRDWAAKLLHVYPLRAADSLQLAAALVWCRSRSTGRAFLTFDTRLADAATQVGFTVLGP